MGNDTDTPEARLSALGIVLPEPAAPIASYVPSVEVGGVIYISGQLPFVDGVVMTGRLGEDRDVEFGQAAARVQRAGLDGVQNKIHPGDPLDKNLYDLPPAELAEVPTVCGSLREALDSLDADREFLKKGGVMDDDAARGGRVSWECCCRWWCFPDSRGRVANRAD